jgi:hypothetical protein
MARQAGWRCPAQKTQVHREGVGRLQHAPMFQAGVQVVASRWPGRQPPPSGTPGLHSIWAAGQMKWMCESMPPADDQPSQLMTSVPGLMMISTPVRPLPACRWRRCPAADAA